MLKQKILDNACVNHKLIAFRTEKEEWGETIVGYVKEVTSQRVTINELDDYGMPIGITSFKIDALIDIVIEDKTLKCLEILEGKNKRLTRKECSTIWGNGCELREYLYDYKKNRKPITLFVAENENDDTNVIGFVDEVDEKSVLIEMIDRYGELDGKILIPLETITGIRRESQEDIARWILYQNRR